MTPRTVLLVDDSRVARMMTRSVVERACPGWTILEAASGDEALQAAAGATPPDFVLMDVNMPGQSGLDAARLFRDRFPAILVSLLTANIQDSIREQAAAMGVGYISKPLKDELLLDFLTRGTGAP